MINDYLSITTIFADLYKNPETLKIINYHNEDLITADISKILSSLNITNSNVKYFVKQIRNVFKSQLIHRKYFVMIIHNLILFMNGFDKKEIFKKLIKSKNEIEVILDAEKISLEQMTKLEIIRMVHRFYQNLSFSLEKLSESDDICKISIYKIKS